MVVYWRLICIPEVLMDLLTPIWPYLYMTCVGWHLCQIWHFWHKWHKWRIQHPIFVMSRWGNMGVKRCVRTTRMQTNALKQLLNMFNSLKYRYTDFLNFPLYFFIFPLYNVRPLGYGCVAPRKKCKFEKGLRIWCIIISTCPHYQFF